MKEYLNYGVKVNASTLANDLSKFYSNLNLVNFDEISEDKVTELKKKVRQIDSNQYMSLITKYTRVVHTLTTSSEKFGINNATEKYVTFMLTMDPNFDMYSTYCAQKRLVSGLKPEDQKKKIKEKMWTTFGVYDVNLINFENRFIRAMKEKKNQEIQSKKR